MVIFQTHKFPLPSRECVEVRAHTNEHKPHFNAFVRFNQQVRTTTMTRAKTETVLAQRAHTAAATEKFI